MSALTIQSLSSKDLLAIRPSDLSSPTLQSDLANEHKLIAFQLDTLKRLLNHGASIPLGIDSSNRNVGARMRKFIDWIASKRSELMSEKGVTLTKDELSKIAGRGHNAEEQIRRDCLTRIGGNRRIGEANRYKLNVASFMNLNSLLLEHETFVSLSSIRQIIQTDNELKSINEQNKLDNSFHELSFQVSELLN